jgi:hypothetical protein
MLVRKATFVDFRSEPKHNRCSRKHLRVAQGGRWAAIHYKPTQDNRRSLVYTWHMLLAMKNMDRSRLLVVGTEPIDTSLLLRLASTSVGFEPTPEAS